MWKFVTRGIRETLERRACRTNVYSQTSQQQPQDSKKEVKQSLACQQKFVPPMTFAFNKGLCGSAKNCGTKDNEYDSKWKARHIWFEAVGWSSVLAVGWVVCQTLCLRRRLYETEDNIKNKLSQFSEIRLSHLFGNLLNLEPTIFPVVHCAGKESHQIREDTEPEWLSGKPYGPITAEEALEEAAAELLNAHKLMMSEFELQSGLRAVDEKRYKDAIQHFTAGADLSSPASMFNLGVCYELGLGTLVDQAKAAKWYTNAAEKGHADAMYNLGVFHAQGRAGFTRDSTRAHNYFLKAAELGQVQARRALDLEEQAKRKEEKKNSVFQDTHENSLYHVDNKITNHSFRMTYPEKTVDNKGKSPTEVFLNYLGLTEPSLVPVVGP